MLGVRRSLPPSTSGVLSVAITGASHGIGRALALRYAGPGVQMALIAKDDLDGAVTECEARGAAVEAADIDIRDIRSARFLRMFDKRHPVDILFANAGVSPATSVYGLDTSIRSARAILDVNVLGTVTTVNALIGRMAARRSGHVVITSSIAAYIATGDSPAYCASKAATLAYGRAMRHRYRRHGVQVTVACPGYVRSRLTEGYHRDGRWLIEPENCAAQIAKAVEHKLPEIAFPRFMAFTAKHIHLFPTFIVDWWVDKFQYQ